MRMTFMNFRTSPFPNPGGAWQLRVKTLTFMAETPDLDVDRDQGFASKPPAPKQGLRWLRTPGPGAASVQGVAIKSYEKPEKE